jgi:type II secretory pathway component GspD/PulD (secretin)
MGVGKIGKRSFVKSLRLSSYWFPAFVLLASFMQTDATAQDSEIDEDATISYEFVAEKVEDAMQILSDMSGLNIIVSNKVTGTISAYIYEMNAEKALKEIAEVNGYHYIRNNDIVWILSDEEYFEGLNLGLERRIVSLNYTDVETVSTIIKEIGGPETKVIPYPAISVIVLVENSDRIEQTLSLIKQIDSPAPLPEIRVISLQYAAATDIARVLYPHLTYPDDIQIDVRTNQLILRETPDTFADIKKLLLSLDVPDLVVTKTIPLRYANARDVAELVEEILMGRKRESGSGSLSSPNKNSPPPQIPTAQPRQSPTEGTASTATNQLVQPSSSIPISPVIASQNDFDIGNDESLALGPLSSVSYNERTNTVIVTHTESVLKRIESIIESVDIPDIYHIYQFQNANPAELDIEGKLAAFFPTEQPFVAVDPISKTVTFRSTPEQSHIIEDLLQQWDAQVQQVRIEAEIMLVKESLVKDLGVKWSVILDGPDDRLDISFPPNITDTSPQFNLSLGTLADNDYTAMVQALSTDNDTQIIASPLITVRDGGQALFSNARREPFTVVTVDGNTQTILEDVQFLDVGITLSVQAIINRQDLITLDVLLEISSLVEIRDGIPVVDTSSAQSSVNVQNNGTIILGGLKSTSLSKVQEGVPVLSKIPLFGNLFRNKHKDKGDFETLLILRPIIVSNSQEIRLTRPPALEEYEPWDLK